jgi:thiamine biosynthesis lipoprotein
MEKVQELMGFHQPDSELSRLNASAHLKPMAIHPWTAEVLQIAQDIHQASDGLFNCGIGQYLVKAGLLPQHFNQDRLVFGGLENLQFIEATVITADMPLCLDLGGIAKGFAVDLAVKTLKEAGIASGCVNAGGDLRAFGNHEQAIQIRKPSNPHELIEVGTIQNGAFATSALYFSKREGHKQSYLIHPLQKQPLEFEDSYSVFADECVYADALTKVVCLSQNINHPSVSQYRAQASIIPHGIQR